jgi:hypothetical protein
LVILAVYNLHDGCCTFAPKVGTMPHRSRKDTPSKQLELGLSTLSRSSGCKSLRDYRLARVTITPWIAKRRELGPQQRRSHRRLEARPASADSRGGQVVR